MLTTIKELKDELNAMMSSFWVDENTDMDGEKIYNSGVYYGLNKALQYVKSYEEDRID